MTIPTVTPNLSTISNKQKQRLKVLFAADYFIRVTRDPHEIARVVGVSVTVLFEVCQSAEWEALLRLMGYEGTPYVENLKRYRYKKRKRQGLTTPDACEQTGDLRIANKVWGAIVESDAHIHVPTSVEDVQEIVSHLRGAAKKYAVEGLIGEVDNA